MLRWLASAVALVAVAGPSMGMSSVGVSISDDAERRQGVISAAKHLQRRNMRSKPVTLDMEKALDFYGGDGEEGGKAAAEGLHRRERREQKFINGTDKVHAHPFVLGDMRSKYVTIEWVGSTKPKQAIIVISMLDDSLTAKTQLWRSTDNGKNFIDESSKLGNESIDSNMLVKNTKFEDMVLVTNKQQTKLFISLDAGNTWESVPFSLKVASDSIYFHPTKSNTLVAVAAPDARVHLSTDFGRTWTDTKVTGVVTIDWAYPNNRTNSSTTCFWSQQRLNQRGHFDLYRTDDLFATTKVIKEDGFDFAIINEYIFMSRLNADGQTMSLEVSEDNGETWNHAHFPADLSKSVIKEQEKQEKGYQILDASEGSVFINVDNDDWEKAHSFHTGNLYVSDKSGTYYTLSLKDHLFLQSVRSDFHKVSSMVGTYITNQLVQSEGIQEFRTVISFDKGGSWKPVKAPEYDWNGDSWNCDATSQGCYLQLHNYISEETTHLIQPIFSLDTAIGLVIAHGLVGRFLEVRNTDLFVSRDGGFTWKAALEGMWSFDVADRGGLIVAAAVGRGKQNSIVFSWDFGETWTKFQFQDQPIAIVKVLSKPGANTRTFNIWGNTAEGLWTIVSLDFHDYLGRPCIKPDDFQTWSPTDGRVSNQRCVLGFKKTYLRRKQNAQCFVDLDSDVLADAKEEACPCTKEDFECDYGYARPNIDAHCQEFEEWNKTKAHPCDSGSETYVESTGYRKVPGDKCEGGVVDQYLQGKTVACPSTSSKTPVVAIVVPTVIAVVALFSIATVMFVYNRKKNYWRARYMALAQVDHDDDLPHTGLDSDNSDDDDDVQLDIAEPVPTSNGGAPNDNGRSRAPQQPTSFDQDDQLLSGSDDETEMAPRR
eukprot:comp12455_c0_seq1/m.7385 comp12455_c0_seq1/g.7385  ORF comp12455_c0_seq1/g.7385 comp12455_c0_seq1/m.7385 type:complete len:879 (-) comp12455_c0_seq1:664-3300(-)